MMGINNKKQDKNIVNIKKVSYVISFEKNIIRQGSDMLENTCNLFFPAR